MYSKWWQKKSNIEHAPSTYPLNRINGARGTGFFSLLFNRSNLVNSFIFSTQFICMLRLRVKFEEHFIWLSSFLADEAQRDIVTK